MKSTILILPLALAACATVPIAPSSEIAGSHEFRNQLPVGQGVWCIAPDGRPAAWTQVYDGGGGRCAAPNRFVIVPICGDGQLWPDPARSEVAAVAARLGADGSLYGDRAGGQAFCIPLPPS